MAETYDLVVIGAGPGGYVAAIRAAQLGLKTACVEGRDRLGGTCLNIGCIPSKALLAASHKLHEAEHGLAAFGIQVGAVKFDLKAMMGHKDKVVDANTKGIEFLFKKHKIAWIRGWGSIAGAGRVAVKKADGSSETIETKRILIASGSESMPLPGVEVDEQRIVTSTGALTLTEVPKRLVVVGGGYIGLEMGSVWGRLGSEVTVVEFLDRIVPNMDGEVGRQFQRTLAKQGFKFKLSTKVIGAKTSKQGVTLTLEPAKGGDPETLEADVVLVSIGRRPFTEGLGLEQAGVALDERKRIKTNAHFETNVPGIYAIGDVIAGPMLAHKAEDEGMAAAEIMAGQSGHVNYDVIPGIVYTWPEVASVGRTEEEVKAAGVEYRVGKFPFTANGRARANNDTDGFVKIIADARTDRVLGVHIIGPEAGSLIHECCVAMEFSASAEDIARTCHGHPTLNEAVKEAALAVAGRPIHI